VQFLDSLLVSVGELIVQELLNDGRFANPSCAHHHHSSPNLHCRTAAATASAAAVAASRFPAHRRQPDAFLLLARHYFPLAEKNRTLVKIKR